MENNFDLKKFLIENKLTKNTKMLSERKGLTEEVEEAYQPKSKLEQIIQAAWTEKDLGKAKQMIIDLIEPSKVKSKDQILSTIKTISSKPRLDQYLANSLLKFEKLGLSEEAGDMKEGENWGLTLDGKPVDIRSIEIDGIDPTDRPDYSDAYIRYAEFEDGTELTPEELDRLQDENYGIIHDIIIDRGLDEVKKEPVMETKLTAKERKLIKLVENALGIQREEYHDSDDLENNTSNDAAYEKAFDSMDESEMVNEKPLPKYENIEKLMQEIEAGTNEAAHSYKMKRMKEIAEMLETKVGSLEEGEGADFVDAKKVKQMKKDIMTLRKQAEKLEKEYDKKFSKKEDKKETVKENRLTNRKTTNKMENFDLRKYLAEGRLFKENKENLYGISQDALNAYINIMDSRKKLEVTGADLCYMQPIESYSDNELAACALAFIAGEEGIDSSEIDVEFAQNQAKIDLETMVWDNFD